MGCPRPRPRPRRRKRPLTKFLTKVRSVAAVELEWLDGAAAIGDRGFTTAIRALPEAMFLHLCRLLAVSLSSFLERRQFVTSRGQNKEVLIDVVNLVVPNASKEFSHFYETVGAAVAPESICFPER